MAGISACIGAAVDPEGGELEVECGGGDLAETLDIEACCALNRWDRELEFEFDSGGIKGAIEVDCALGGLGDKIEFEFGAGGMTGVIVICCALDGLEGELEFEVGAGGMTGLVDVEFGWVSGVG